MTISNILKSQEVVTTKNVKVGVQYLSDSSERAIRVTPSTSLKGRFTVTISNPDSDNELAIVLKKEDLVDFLAAATGFVRYGA